MRVGCAAERTVYSQPSMSIFKYSGACQAMPVHASRRTCTKNRSHHLTISKIFRGRPLQMPIAKERVIQPFPHEEAL